MSLAEAGVEQSLLLGPVGGAGAANFAQDVKVVQYLVNLVSPSPLRPLDEDGRSSSTLVDRIRNFQIMQMRFAKADGRVDPQGRTLRALLEAAGKARGRGRPMPQLSTALGAIQGTPAHRSKAESFMGKALADAPKVKKAQADLNKPGAGSGLTDQDFEAAAKRLGATVEANVLRAFAQVESGGKSGFEGGLPIIAYEGHWFRKLTKKAYDTTHPMLSYKYVSKAGPEWKVNNADQTTAWATLTSAAELDSDAAMQATSWGMFQVMGFNYKSCGYKTVNAFVDAMKLGARGHLEAFVGFCLKTPGLPKAIADKNWVQMATLYNGADYGNYDTRMSKAYGVITGNKK